MPDFDDDDPRKNRLQPNTHVAAVIASEPDRPTVVDTSGDRGPSRATATPNAVQPVPAATNAQTARNTYDLPVFEQPAAAKPAARQPVAATGPHRTALSGARTRTHAQAEPTADVAYNRQGYVP